MIGGLLMVAFLGGMALLHALDRVSVSRRDRILAAVAAGFCGALIMLTVMLWATGNAGSSS